MNPQNLYDKASNWLIDRGTSIILAITLLIIGLWFISLIKKWVRIAMQRREFDPSLQPFLQTIIIISLQVLLIIATMQIVGIQMTIFTALVGTLGVTAGFALSGTLQNFASGVLILALKPFQVGEYIYAQGHEGYVSSIQIFYTELLTPDNRTVVIPNSKLSNEVIVNTSREEKRRLDIEIKFQYNTEVSAVRSAIDQFIITCGDLLDNPVSRIGVSKIESDGYKLIINLWISTRKFGETKLIIQEKLIEHLKTANLLFPGMKTE